MSRHNRERRRGGVARAKAHAALDPTTRLLHDAAVAEDRLKEKLRLHPRPPAYRSAPPSKPRKVRRGDLFLPPFVFGGFKGARFR